jgi:ribosomal protein S18 acetylase RimI-like enzyme
MVKLTIHPSFLPSLIAKSVAELDAVCFSRHGVPTKTQHDDGADRFCSQKDLIYYILAWEKDQLIGETRVYKRTIVFSGQKILLGGIGSVATHPDFRKQGIATQMVKKAMKSLKSESCAVAYLCADAYSLKALEFYETFKFQRLLQKHTYLGKSGTRYTDTDGLLAPVCARKVFNQIIASPVPFDISVGNW